MGGDRVVADLAKQCGLSPSGFMHPSKKSFSVPVPRYLLHKRADAAKSLLVHSKKFLLKVALEVGFSDQPAFNRRFCDSVGTSPGQWRRTHSLMLSAFRLFVQDRDC
jgi:AraC-like DNA-binding protein